jgi:plastocyanin
LLVAVVLAVAACGDDGGTDAEGGGAAVGQDAGAGERPCVPVGEDLAGDADTTVDVELADYRFSPSETEVAAGVVTFATSNTGQEAHELAFLPGGGPVPFTPAGEPDEDALAADGAFELEAYGPGGSCEATYELAAGTYTIFCIVASADGETHYEKGMAGTLTVS